MVRDSIGRSDWSLETALIQMSDAAYHSWGHSPLVPTPVVVVLLAPEGYILFSGAVFVCEVRPGDEAMPIKALMLPEPPDGPLATILRLRGRRRYRSPR